MSGKRPPRMRKVNEVLRQVIADECQTLKDPRLGFLTITGVETSPDLRNATVYYSVLDTDSQAAAAALAAASPRIRAAMGRQVRLKYIPRLVFKVDPAIEHGARISAILRRIETREGGEDATEG